MFRTSPLWVASAPYAKGRALLHENPLQNEERELVTLRPRSPARRGDKSLAVTYIAIFLQLCSLVSDAITTTIELKLL